MANETSILMWWLIFGGTHVVGSTLAVRNFLIAKIGAPAFKGLYSLVALATFVTLCRVYFANKHAGALLFAPPAGSALAGEALMALALIVLVQGLATPNPLATAAELSGHFTNQARGIQRLTRHPVNCAFALFGLAHMLTNPFVGDWIFFGGFVVYTILSAYHQDARGLVAGRDEVKQFLADTSLWPLAAIAAGRQRLALAEYNRIALLASVGIFFVLRYFHASLFGGVGG